METGRAKRLAGFASWVGANLRRDEKKEAQVFLDRFFQGFGHPELREAAEAKGWDRSTNQRHY